MISKIFTLLFSKTKITVFYLDNCREDICDPNAILKPGSYIQSKNGLFRFVLNQTGKLEIWCKDRIIWSKNADIADVDFLYFDKNSKMILIGKDNSTEWIMSMFTRGTKHGILLMQNDGNLVVYDECDNIYWQSRSYGKCGAVSGIYFSYIKYPRSRLLVCRKASQI